MRHKAFVLTPLEEKIITAYKSGMKPVEITHLIEHKKASQAVSVALEKYRLQLLVEREKNQTHAPTSPSVAKGRGRIRGNRAPLAKLTRNPGRV